MQLSKEVIRDLLPVYVAGEASPDTRALVEQSLGGDADLRAEAGVLGAIPIATATPPAALELATLQRTQSLLRQRTVLVGSGYLLTTLALALVGRNWGPAWFGVPALRLAATACPMAATAVWIVFVRNARQLNGAGFEPLRSRGPLWAWGFACWWSAFSAAVANDWFPGHFGAFLGAFVPVTFVFWAIGLKLRSVTHAV